MFHTRKSPTCVSESVKIQLHVQCEEPETGILTVTSRVLNGYVPKFICTIKIRTKESFLDDNQEQQTKCECFSVLMTKSDLLSLGRIRHGYPVIREKLH